MSATIERYKARLVARTPFELKELVSALPGARWDKSARAWTYPATSLMALTLRDALAGRVAAVELDDEARAMIGRAELALGAQHYRTDEALPDVPSGSEFPAWTHQRQAFFWGREQEAFFFDATMGAGKSRMLVDLINEWDAQRVVIVCPKNVMRVWPREFRKHSLRGTERVTDGRPFKRDGTLKKTASVAERVRHLDEMDALPIPLVVVVNYEACWREPLADWLLERRWDVGFLDESHRAQAPGGRASRFLDRLRDRCDRRGGGTGTRGDTDLAVYGYCRFIEPSLFGTNASKFKQRYGRPRVKYWQTDVDSNGEIVQTPVLHTLPTGEPIYDGVRDDLADELAEKLATISFHCGDEVIPLDKPLDHTVPVELTAKTQRIYNDLSSKFVAEVVNAETDEHGLVVVDNVLTKLLRLQQITSGHVPVEPGSLDGDVIDLESSDAVVVPGAVVDGVNRIEHIGTEKEDAVADWLADVPHNLPVIMFAHFRHDLAAVKRIADKVGRYAFGELSGKGDTLLDDEAVMRGDVTLGAVQLQSGGVGVDLTRARIAGYYSHGSSLINYSQSRSRLWRPGQQQEHPVEFVHFVAEGTIDELVVEGLNNKQEGIDYVTAKLRERIARKVAA